MSVATRFAKLLSTAIDPQSYHALRTAAQERVKTLDDHLMELAANSLPGELFARIKTEAETREAQAQIDASTVKKQIEMPSTIPAAPEINHVQARLAERFSIQISKQEIKEIETLIKAGSPAVKLLKQNVAVTKHYEVQIKDKIAHVVYSPQKDCVLTAFPLKRYQKNAPRVSSGRPNKSWKFEGLDE